MVARGNDVRHRDTRSFISLSGGGNEIATPPSLEARSRPRPLLGKSRILEGLGTGELHPERASPRFQLQHRALESSKAQPQFNETSESNKAIHTLNLDEFPQ